MVGMMTMSNGRVLKSHELQGHDIVLVNERAESSASIRRDSAASFVTPPSEEEILLFTAEEVEDLCEKARASGAAQAAATLEPALVQVAQAMETFAHDQSEAMHWVRGATAQAIVDMSTTVTRWVLGRELSDPTALLELVSRALADRSSTVESTLRVHPDLVPLVFEVAPDNLHIVGDAKLEHGEFRVESDGPHVAFRFDTALDRAQLALDEGEGR